MKVCGFPIPAVTRHSVPTDLLRAGVIQVQNAAARLSGVQSESRPVTVDGVTYPSGHCPAGACDPRGLGINPIVCQDLEYADSDGEQSLGGDQYNTQGFLSTIRAPLTSNNYVGRIDHDFNEKWHFYAQYRDFKLINLTTNQVDIGGVLAAIRLARPTATAPRPQQPSVWTAGLTTTINAEHHQHLRLQLSAAILAVVGRQRPAPVAGPGRRARNRRRKQLARPFPIT